MSASPTTSDPRGRRLRRLVDTAAAWLALQGLAALLGGPGLAAKLNLRWSDSALLWRRDQGLAFLALGLFVRSAVREPRRQYLAVDTLILLFAGQAYFLLAWRVTSGALMWGEWLSLAAALALTAGLMLNRTPSKRMESAGGLVSLSLPSLLRQIRHWFAGGEAPDLGLGPLTPAEAPRTVPEPAPAPAGPPKPIPEAAFSPLTPEEMAAPKEAEEPSKPVAPKVPPPPEAKGAPQTAPLPPPGSRKAG